MHGCGGAGQGVAERRGEVCGTGCQCALCENTESIDQ